MFLFEQAAQFWYWLVLGLMIAIMLGPLTKFFLDYINEQIPVSRPRGIDPWSWSQIVHVPGANSARRIGAYERVLFFFAIWAGHPELIAGRLVLRVAAKWDSWANITRIPAYLDGAHQTDWLIARKSWAARTMQRFVGGQLLNIFWAALGVAVYLILVELSSICLGLKGSGLLRNFEIACA